MSTHTHPAFPLCIFLCHSSGDKPAVRKLYNRLREDGYLPWLDEEDLVAGQQWDKEISKAVRRSDVVLVCLSRDSINKRGFVQKEIKFALDVAEEQPEDTIFIIPLKLEECDVPDRLSRWHWVNFFDEAGYERLTRALERCAKTAISGQELSSQHPKETNSPQSLATLNKTPRVYEPGVKRELSFEESKEVRGVNVSIVSRFIAIVKRRLVAIVLGGLLLTGLGLAIPLILNRGKNNKIGGPSTAVSNSAGSESDEAIGRSLTPVEPLPSDTVIRQPRTAAEFYQNSSYFFSIRSYDAAIRDLRRAVELQPEFPEAHNRLGRALLLKGQYGAAADSFRTAAQQRGGDYPTAHYNLGFALQLQGKTDDAISAYNDAIKSSGGKHADAYYQIGSILVGIVGRAGEAVEPFRRAIEQNGGRDPEAHFKLGVALAQQKDYANAATAFREAIGQRGGDFAYAHYNLALVYQETGNLPEAVNELETFLQQAPDDANRRPAENILRDLRRRIQGKRNTK